MGILISDAFLSRLGPHTRVEWDDLHPGRLAALRLSSRQGALDIFVIYGHSGARAQDRGILRRLLQRAIRPAVSAMTILGGDWNYVEFTEDRLHTREAVDTGHHDRAETSAPKRQNLQKRTKTCNNGRKPANNGKNGRGPKQCPKPSDLLYRARPRIRPPRALPRPYSGWTDFEKLVG